jgi:hypothetical protein
MRSFTNSHKTLLVGIGLLAAGVAAGWSTSRIADHAQQSQQSADSSLVAVQEPSAGNITPQQQYQPAPVHRTPVRRASRAPARRVNRGITIPAGEAVRVAVNQALSSKTAAVGQSWSGTVVEPVFAGGRLLIPAGSRVSGTVVVADPAQRGDRARLQLAMSSITANGRTYRVRGSSEAIVAGSPRTRNLASIAGATAAGALIGKAVGGTKKSTIIGAAVGAGAATAVVAKSQGYQATIPAGKELVFTTA